jgi:hypothetical protein
MLGLLVGLLALQLGASEAKADEDQNIKEGYTFFPGQYRTSPEDKDLVLFIRHAFTFERRAVYIVPRGGRNVYLTGDMAAKVLEISDQTDPDFQKALQEFGKPLQFLQDFGRGNCYIGITPVGEFSFPTERIRDIVDEEACNLSDDIRFRLGAQAIAWIESRGDPKAIGDYGLARGLFQNHPLPNGRGWSDQPDMQFDARFNASWSLGVADPLYHYFLEGLGYGVKTGPDLTFYMQRHGQRSDPEGWYAARDRYEEWLPT